ncbi:hypothetical protein [Kutzneria sp. CA-103260]|uniref:hypothetical protein n=1 Tax=Kutzneria sp. CA-103260 TaxID=2802641 RepID=UPI001BAB12BC|nr:hypothetical protein [Kutzneria sp. CA-103260]QUQ70352.1 hypothetical protein JJ691_81280 [Kutzneria sp. CA-103260]
MTGYEVSPAALKEAAEGIRKAMAELKSIGNAELADSGRGITSMEMGDGTAGHAGVAKAFSDFCERWEWGVRDLIQTGSVIADDLEGTGTLYAKAEQFAVDALKRVAFDAIGDPHADSGRAADMSWQQIGDQLTPDLSADSFQKAQQEMGQTWERTGEDLARNNTASQLGRMMNGEDVIGEELGGLREIVN